MVLDRFPAVRLERILIEIAAKKRIEVALHLKSGSIIEGRVIDARREGLQGSVLLQRDREDEVIYVELASIEALAIKNASQYADALSFGAIEDISTEPVLQPDELEMFAADLAKRTGDALTIEIVWGSFKPTETARHSLAETLRAVATAFDHLALDASGRTQLAAIRTISIENGAGPLVEREGSDLRVICALEMGRAGRVDAIGLLTAIGASTPEKHS
jgi:hypothetical protein